MWPPTTSNQKYCYTHKSNKLTIIYALTSFIAIYQAINLMTIYEESKQYMKFYTVQGLNIFIIFLF